VNVLAEILDRERRNEFAPKLVAAIRDLGIDPDKPNPTTG
jgi:hypothetical protein